MPLLLSSLNSGEAKLSGTCYCYRWKWKLFKSSKKKNQKSLPAATNTQTVTNILLSVTNRLGWILQNPIPQWIFIQVQSYPTIFIETETLSAFKCPLSLGITRKSSVSDNSSILKVCKLCLPPPCSQKGKYLSGLLQTSWS